MDDKTNYGEYVNWDKVPKEISHVRFETMIKRDDYFICHGIEVVPRPEEDKKIAIIAGNHREYLNFIESINNPSGRRKYFYVNDINSLIGRRDFKFLFYGSCRERKDYEKIYEYIMSHDIEVATTL